MRLRSTILLEDTRCQFVEPIFRILEQRYNSFVGQWEYRLDDESDKNKDSTKGFWTLESKLASAHQIGEADVDDVEW